MPWADKLYGCDVKWWNHYEGVPEFAGEKWTACERDPKHHNHKAIECEKYSINAVRGAAGYDAGFSFNPEIIHYGDNSGFQAVNLALLLGSTYVVLVGFNFGGKGHFFGDHPQPLYNQDNYTQWLKHFDTAQAALPDHVTIINATPDSKLTSFPMMSLEDAINDYYRLHRHWTVADLARYWRRTRQRLHALRL
jgi:hypothetical protein